MGDITMNTVENFKNHILISTYHYIWFEGNSEHKHLSGYMNNRIKYTIKKEAQQQADKYNNFIQKRNGIYIVKTIKEYEVFEPIPPEAYLWHDFSIKKVL